ncbi:DUF2795 domain-containing protein [Microbacterium sp. SYP-A9085]|uniref:DUF2795 domain-containing protein n=1 Tax=Microbacterium sp. SYP-A9085 TaxID=2664454 RepID=UPI001562C640|nr:DUF2795 domain-containing protein [Microbacterium sp. SYP-A9085]
MHATATLTRFLAEMEYPATKDDLLREGIRADLPWHDLHRLERLPDGGYPSAWLVRHELSTTSGVRHPGGMLAGTHPEPAA